MNTLRRFASSILLAACLSRVTAPAAEATNAVDWEKFMARQDLVWNSLPNQWESGAFVGNGLLGSMIYSESANTLQWDVGRSDVTDKGDRVAIGRFVVGLGRMAPGGNDWTSATITRGTMRLDLWNAEARGRLATDQGAVQWRSFTHAKDLVNVIEFTQDQTDPARPLLQKVEFQYQAPNPARAEAQGTEIPENQKNPEPAFGRVTDDKTGAIIQWCKQDFKAGGGYVVAWAGAAGDNGANRFFYTVDYTPTNAPATNDAVAEISSVLNEKFDDLVASHRAWWHDYYRESFLSIPDARMESFYWIQMYKLGSATRADRPAIDLMGPWFRKTPWPHLWWNLNIQLTYWPVYTANRLELGESLIHMLDADKKNFINNVPSEWRSDSAGIGRSSPYDGVRSVADSKHASERGDLTWVLHNYWLQYRYSGDETMLKDRLYPLLKLSIGYYLHLLSKGDDGKLHLPPSISPEYPASSGTGNAEVRDANYDLSLLRWGLNTLLACNERFGLNDSLAPKWTETLQNLAPNPVDKNGFMVGSDQPFAVSHRHYSHLFSIYPLHLLDPQSTNDQPLIEKSLDHWKSMPKAWRGYSYTGSSAMSSWLGRNNDALDLLEQFLDKPRTILPNTMYTEAGPVIETPLSGAASIMEMVLQSWATNTFGTHIRVFPAVPDAWKDVSFDKLRAEGAFEVSAVRRDGRTKFVQIKSLAGNPCRVSTSLEGTIVASGDRPFTLTTEMEDGRPVTVIDLKKGETVMLTSADDPPADYNINAVNAPGIQNFYGSPKTKQ